MNRRKGDPFERYAVEDRGHNTPCWIWQGAMSAGKSGKGLAYGRLHNGERLVYAHRAFYEKHVGPIPQGLVLDHLCRVTACVNPDHLEVVTYAENNRRVEYEYPVRTELSEFEQRVMAAYNAIPMGPAGKRPQYILVKKLREDFGLESHQLDWIRKVAGRS